MGGSGGGRSDFGGSHGSESEGGNGGGGGGGGAPDPCVSYSAKTILASPKAAVVGTLKVGDKLDVELSPGQKPPVLVKTKTNQAAGAVAPRGLAELVKCLKAGNKYKATVTAINGGAVTVEIKWEP